MDNASGKSPESAPSDKDTEDKWLRLYDIVHGEEQHFSSEHHRRVNFFIGLALALIAATVGGLFQVKEAYQYLVLLLGPVATILISWIGMRACNDIYRRWLEAVTKKMKLEHLLRLDKPPGTSQESDPWWQKEPFVPSRYLRNRKNVPSDITTDSAKWVEYYQIHGPYTGKMRWLSTIFIVVAAVLALFLVVQFAVAMCASSPPHSPRECSQCK